MHIELPNVSRRPPYPAWALSLVLLWLALGVVAVWLSAHTGYAVRLCLFKRLTGMPCLTCGLTRGTLAILDGQLVSGFLYNPLLFSVLAIFSAAVLGRIVFARAVRIRLSPKGRVIAWLLAVALCLANWAYVVIYIG